VLVMRRRAGESILLGSEIEIEVLEVCGSRVKLGIVAPDSVFIQRKELQITRDENLVAARSVEHHQISSLLLQVGVNSLTPAPALTSDAASAAIRKNTRTVPAVPDMTL
jgi:carbon storage regulator